MSLQLQSVHLSLGGRPVVQGVTLELQPGEVVGLLGPCLLYTSPSPRD